MASPKDSLSGNIATFKIPSGETVRKVQLEYYIKEINEWKLKYNATTMWPNSWDLTKIKNVIKEATENITNHSGNLFKGTTKEGYNIEFRIDKTSKEIETAYLIFQKMEKLKFIKDTDGLPWIEVNDKKSNLLFDFLMDFRHYFPFTQDEKIEGLKSILKGDKTFDDIKDPQVLWSYGEGSGYFEIEGSTAYFEPDRSDAPRIVMPLKEVIEIVEEWIAFLREQKRIFPPLSHEIEDSAKLITSGSNLIESN